MADLNVSRIEYISGDEGDFFGNDSYVVSLLHMDGANASTTFTESAAAGTHTWTPSGNAQITTAQSIFGGACGVFDGTGDFIQTPYSADFDFGTGDFTIDFWVRFNAMSGVAGTTYSLGVIARMTDNNNVNTIHVSTPSSNNHNLNFVAIVGGVTKASYNFAWTGVTTATWYHIAIVRNTSNFYMFINGLSQSLTVVTAISSNSITPAVNEAMTIGRYGNYTGYDFNGCFDEYRISKGIARLTANFLPPPRAYGTDGQRQTSYTILGNLVPARIETVTASEPAASLLLPTLIISIFDALSANEIYSPVLDQLLIQASEAIDSGDISQPVLDTLLLSMIDTITQSDLPQSLLEELVIQLLETISTNDLSPSFYYDFVIQMLETLSASDTSSQESMMMQFFISMLEAITGSESSLSEMFAPDKLVQMIETLTGSDALQGVINPLLVQASEAIANSEISQEVLAQLIIKLFETVSSSDVGPAILTDLAVRILEILASSDQAMLTKEFLTLQGQFLFNRFGRTAPSVTAGGNFKFAQNKTQSPSRTAGGNFKYKKPKDN